jgi:hypothetical protein
MNQWRRILAIVLVTGALGVPRLSTDTVLSLAGVRYIGWLPLGDDAEAERAEHVCRE